MFTFVDALIINVVLNNILGFKLLKCCIAIHVSRFCTSSRHNDMALSEKNKFCFPYCNILGFHVTSTIKKKGIIDPFEILV